MKKKLISPWLLPLGISVAFLIWGFLVETPKEIAQGLTSIMLEPSTLITDYIVIAGLGSAFVNAGILGLILTLITIHVRDEADGVTIAALFLIMGFALFGKNLFNVWFILAGIVLHSFIFKVDLKSLWVVGLFGTAMAPMVSDLIYSASTPEPFGWLAGTAAGMATGLLLPIVSEWLKKIHDGHNLYNVGFAAGIIGTVFVSIFKSYGYMPAPRLIWNTDHQFVLFAFMNTLFGLMIIAGSHWNPTAWKSYKKLLKTSGQAPTDYLKMFGSGVMMINMGVNGMLATTYILAIGGDLNGPTLGGVLTIVGFGAAGKHFMNVLPIFAGIYLGALTKIWHVTDPALQLAALFGTGLAPFAGRFGWGGGILAAFIHMSVVLNVGGLHGGLNLYNNGFSAGIVAMILLPIFERLRVLKEERSKVSAQDCSGIEVYEV
ncbi:DUF1576 domain-containing protein [Fusibacter sp. JL216-2]|uniref:DUF1576 domain-containing protein n=1 Tax=Fusibacter sp. JL216-2 TaxID=3071453 RepID=UPI003D336DEF